MRVLITGAGGFIGKACVAGFSQAGWDVRAVSRKHIAGGPHVEAYTISELGAETDWPMLLSGVDCILHLAGVVHQPGASNDSYHAVNVEGTTRLAREALKANVRQFVFVSSIAVYGRNRDRTKLTEESPPWPEDAYGQSKLDAEFRLQKIASGTSMSWTIVRLPMVYGPGAPGNFRRLAKLIEQNIPLPLKSATALRSYLGVDNLVSALLRVATHPKALNKLYLASDGQDLGTADLIRLMSRGINKKSRLWWFPKFGIFMLARSLNRKRDAERLFSPMRIDSSKIRQELDWLPPLSVQDGISRAMKAPDISE